MGQDGEEEVVDRLFIRVFVEQNIMNMGLGDLGRVARVDGPVLTALNPHVFGGVVGPDDVLGRNSQRLKIGPPQRRRAPDIQDAGDRDA